MKLKYTLQVCTNYSYGTLFLKHWGQISVEVAGKQKQWHRTGISCLLHLLLQEAFKNKEVEFNL